ncbi:MAG: DUF4177 domain-containing protein [Holophagales bacterium]|jgi:hypothetical protein|nr:DUF4177 domain-containing protein [Holophagales bacterium]
MKTSTTIALTALLALGGSYLWTARANETAGHVTAAAAVWEYKTASTTDQKGLPEEELNKLGKEGWELVAINTTDPGIRKALLYTFKKQVG